MFALSPPPLVLVRPPSPTMQPHSSSVSRWASLLLLSISLICGLPSLVEEEEEEPNIPLPSPQLPLYRSGIKFTNTFIYIALKVKLCYNKRNPLIFPEKNEMISDCRIPLPPPSSVCLLPTTTNHPLPPFSPPPPPSSSVFLPPSLLSGCVSPPRCGHASWSKEEKKRKGEKGTFSSSPFKGGKRDKFPHRKKRKRRQKLLLSLVLVAFCWGKKLLFSFFSFWADPLFRTL